MKSGKFSSWGFSLVEMIVVIGLLAMMAALSMPDLSRFYKNFRLRQYADEMISTMRYAQGRAILKQRTARLSFDDRERSYVLMENLKSEDDNSVAVFGRIKNREGRDHVLPEDIRLETSKNEFYFYPDGRIDKTEINLCRKDDCLAITTGKRRNAVLLLQARR